MPEVFKQFLIQTPVLVSALLAYLIFRDVRARRPAKTSLFELAIIPAIFTAWSLADPARLYGLKTETIGWWLAGMALGAVIGWRLLASADIPADHQPASLSGLQTSRCCRFYWSPLRQTMPLLQHWRSIPPWPRSPASRSAILSCPAA